MFYNSGLYLVEAVYLCNLDIEYEICLVLNQFELDLETFRYREKEPRVDWYGLKCLE